MTAKKKNEREENDRAAERLKAMIAARTGVSPDHAKCPREKSDAVSCIVRDGKFALDYRGGLSRKHPICAGCEASLTILIANERQKAAGLEE